MARYGAPEIGSLAGSTLTMDVAVRHGAQEVGLPLPVVVAAATATRRPCWARPKAADLAPGQPAGVVHLDDDLRVVRVMRVMWHGAWVP